MRGVYVICGHACGESRWMLKTVVNWSLILLIETVSLKHIQRCWYSWPCLSVCSGHSVSSSKAGIPCGHGRCDMDPGTAAPTWHVCGFWGSKLWSSFLHDKDLKKSTMEFFLIIIPSVQQYNNYLLNIDVILCVKVIWRWCSMWEHVCRWKTINHHAIL